MPTSVEQIQRRIQQEEQLIASIQDPRDPNRRAAEAQLARLRQALANAQNAPQTGTTTGQPATTTPATGTQQAQTTRPPSETQLAPGQTVVRGQFAETPVVRLSPAQVESARAIEDAMYARQTRLLDQQWQQRQNQMEQQLINRGIDPNSEAGRTMRQQFETARSDAYSDARQQAVMAGTAEQQRLFGNQAQYDEFRNRMLLGEMGANAQIHSANSSAGAALAASQANQALGQAQLDWQRQMGQNTFGAQQQQQSFENDMRLREMFMREMGGFFAGSNQFPQIGMPNQPGGANVSGAFNNWQQGQNNVWNANASQSQANAQASQANQQAWIALLASMFGG